MTRRTSDILYVVGAVLLIGGAILSYLTPVDDPTGANLALLGTALFAAGVFGRPRQPPGATP